MQWYDYMMYVWALKYEQNPIRREILLNTVGEITFTPKALTQVLLILGPTEEGRGRGQGIRGQQVSMWHFSTAFA